jgi:hypothetical protein
MTEGEVGVSIADGEAREVEVSALGYKTSHITVAGKPHSGLDTVELELLPESTAHIKFLGVHTRMDIVCFYVLDGVRHRKVFAWQGSKGGPGLPLGSRIVDAGGTSPADYWTMAEDSYLVVAPETVVRMVEGGVVRLTSSRSDIFSIRATLLDAAASSGSENIGVDFAITGVSRSGADRLLRPGIWKLRCILVGGGVLVRAISVVPRTTLELAIE